MKFFQLIALLSVTLVSARPAASIAPDVDVQIKFPDTNAFGRVLNGASNNQLNVRLDNHGSDEIVLSKIYGEYYEPHGKERKLGKTTVATLRESIPGGSKSRVLPYRFHSENKIGEVGLRVWVEILDSKKKVHKLQGYESTVTIVEQPGSWFDPALLFTYVVLGSIVGFIGYLLYGSYFVSTTTKKGKRKARSVSSQVTEKAKEVGEKVDEGLKNGVDESWLPDHILRQRKKDAKGAGATSGSESEGTPSKKAGGKKGKK